MRKIDKIVLLVLGCLMAFVSCRKTETEPIQWKTSLQVVSDDLIFFPSGGQGTLVLSESVSKVTPSSSWVSATVSGNTVNVTVDEWQGKESRYSTLTVSSSTESIDVTVIQYGEVIAGLDLADISVPYTGTSVSLDVKLNVEMTISADQDWIHATYDPEEGTVSVVVDANPNPETRTGVVYYQAGSVSGTIDVIQNPPYTQAEDWVLTPGDAFYDYPDFQIPATLTPAVTSDQYVLVSVSKNAVGEEITEDYIFSTLASEIRRSIQEEITVSGGSFADALLAGEQTVDLDVNVGDYYLVAIGFGDNSFVTGKYQYSLVSIGDVRPPFFKWVGNWNVSRKNTKYDEMDVWEITIKDMDKKTLNIHGIEGFDNPARYDAEATVDEETGELVLRTQNCGQYQDDTRGTITVLLSGQYTNVNGKTYYSSSLNVVLLRGTLSEDSSSAVLNPGSVTSAGSPASFFNIQFYGRYTNASGGTSAVSWNAGPTQIPQTITRRPE